MATTVRAVIIGNCQAQMLEGMMVVGNRALKVEPLAPVYTMTHAHRDAVTEAMTQADVIFLQRVSSTYHLDWLRPLRVKADFPNKTIVWPNVYFDGYFPDAEYIYMQHYGKLQGPLEDYHMRRVVDAYKKGMPVEAAAALLDETAPNSDATSFEVSIDNLRERESDVDIPMSRFLEEEVGRAQCFYTPNHPDNTVLAALSQRLAKRAGIPFDYETGRKFGFRLDKVRMPIYPSVARARSIETGKIEFDGFGIADVTPSAVQLGDKAIFSTLEVVEQFYRVYDKAFPKAHGAEKAVPAPAPRPAERAAPAPVVLPPVPTAPVAPAPIAASAPGPVRVGVVGFFDRGNFHSDMFHTVLKQSLPDYTLHPIDGVTVCLTEESRQEFLNTIDCVIIGGGDIVSQSTWAAWYFAEIFLHKPVFLFSLAIQTWAPADDEVVGRLSRFFQHPSVRLCVARDLASAAWLRQTLHPAVPVQYFPDAVCAWDVPERSVKPDRKRVFTLITRDQVAGEIHWGNLENLCRRARSYGYTIRNLVLGTGEVSRHDRELLTREVPTPNWELITSEDPEALIKALSQSDVVASMKYVGCMLAAMYGIPAIGLITTDKFNSFFREIERPDLNAHHKQADLADRLAKFVAPIPKATGRELRSGARQGLTVLQEALDTAFAERAAAGARPPSA